MKKLLLSLTIAFTPFLSISQGVFCHPSITIDCVTQPNYIDSVVITNASQNFNNGGTNCNTQDNNYAFYKNFLVAEFRSDSFDLRIALNKQVPSNIGVWVDWNKDSIFSISENIYTSSTAQTAASINLKVPVTANLDTLIMRVRTAPAFTGSCDASSTGETEDYRFLVLNPTSTSIHQANVREGLKIYPNPSSNVLNITINNQRLYSLDITDVSGRVVYVGSLVNSESIDVSNLESGNYFVRLRNAGEVLIEKIMIN